MTTLDLAQVAERVNGFTSTVFRLETLDLYSTSDDGHDFANYLRGAPGPDPARKEPWLDRLRDEHRQGRDRFRVRVLRQPLSDYLRYECEWGYAPNSEAGEDIRILDLTEPGTAALAVDHDFWLIDQRDVIRMHYDSDGRFTGGELVPGEDVPRYMAVYVAAIMAAEPFGTWWPRHPQYLRANYRASVTSHDE